MEQGKKISVAGTILVSLYVFILLVILLFNFVPLGLIGDQLEYLGYVVLSAGALFTSVHLWSRMASFTEGTSIRTLFKMMGVTFIPIALVFVFFLLDSYLLKLWEVPTISGTLNSIGTILIASFIDPEGLGSMNASDVLWFSLIMVGISFYIWPLEKFVKNRKPWFAASLWICLVAIVVFVIAIIAKPILLDSTDFNIVVTILLLATVIILATNFIFMFYLYISLAAKSAGRMRSASVLVAVGLIMMIMIWVTNLLLQGESYRQFIVLGLGIMSLLLFNVGFRIMR